MPAVPGRVAGALLAALVLLGGLLLASCGRSGASAAGGLAALPCGERVRDATVTAVVPDRSLDAAWAAYGDHGDGWVAGDSVHAYRLPGGQVLWTFADSFLGPLPPSGHLGPSTPFVHSTAVVQDGSSFRTIWASRPGKPRASLLPDAHRNQAYLALAGIAANGRLQLLYLRERIAGEVAIEQPADEVVASFALPSLRLVSVRRLAVEERGVVWGAAVSRLGGRTYVYGASASGGDKDLYVALAPDGDLAGRWRYWDGQRFVANPARAVPIMTNVSSELSVTSVDGMDVLVTTPTDTAYSNLVAVGFACRPTGPFTLATAFRASDQTGPLGERRFGVGDVYVYDAMDQAALNEGDRLLVSYDQNTVNPKELPTHPAVYRPGYLWVTIGPRRPAGGRG